MFFFLPKLLLPHSSYYHLVPDYPVLDPDLPHEHFTCLQRARGAMDLNLKLVLDELNHRFDAQDQKWESRFSNLEQAQFARAKEVDQRVAALESTATVLKSNHAEIAKADVSTCLANLEVVYGGQSDDIHMRLTTLESIRVDDIFAETMDLMMMLETAATDLAPGTRRSKLSSMISSWRSRRSRRRGITHLRLP
jgi:hypothetical protein